MQPGRLLAWDRQDGEGDKAFAAFVRYRDMHPSVRSIRAAYEAQTGKKLETRQPPRQWLTWSSKWQWIDRARAYDAHLELVARQQREDSYSDQLRQHLDQQNRLATAAVEASIRLIRHANARMAEVETASKNGKSKAMPEDITRCIRAAVAAGDAASAARAEALGVDKLLEIVDDQDDD